MQLFFSTIAAKGAVALHIRRPGLRRPVQRGRKENQFLSLELKNISVPEMDIQTVRLERLAIL